MMRFTRENGHTCLSVALGWDDYTRSRLLFADRVTVELFALDLHRGRIVYRYRLVALFLRPFVSKPSQRNPTSEAALNNGMRLTSPGSVAQKNFCEAHVSRRVFRRNADFQNHVK